MGMQSGPPGYPSNTAALWHLIRHGPAVWPLHRFAALLFHVERSTAYGKDSDQHSQGQATEGIYSHTAERRDGGRGRWIRGGAGISRAQLNRANAALLKDGLIHKITRRGKNNAHAATEFIPDWLAIRDALEEHELRKPAPQPQPLIFQEGRHGTSRSPLSQGETRLVSHRDKGLSQGETHSSGFAVVDSTVSESREREAAAGQAPDTHSLSREEENQSTPAGEVAALIESLYGRPLRPNDAIPGQVLAIAQRVGVPTRALCFFLQDKANELQARNYTITSPLLFVTVTGTDLIPWARANRNIIESAAREERQAAARAQYAAAPIEIPAAAAQPQPQLCPQCQQEALIDGTCHSNECVNQREHERTTHRRAAQGS
ncbi:MAG: hypothetical protein ABSC05_35905 [Candidatus Solibacter sp.]|jgi:hypothetical protein